MNRLKGELQLGRDPELSEENQIMEEIAFLSFDELNKMDKAVLHGLFNEVILTEKVVSLRGFIYF